MQPHSQEARSIDAALCTWQQGDVALDVGRFVHVATLTNALTDEAAQAGADAEDPAAITTAVKGITVITQTCDVVRSCVARPFVEVSPLVEVNDDVLHEIQRARRPNYAFMPGVDKQRLVADLDRVMTVEKSVRRGSGRRDASPTTTAVSASHSLGSASVVRSRTSSTTSCCRFKNA